MNFIEYLKKELEEIYCGEEYVESIISWNNRISDKCGKNNFYCQRCKSERRRLKRIIKFAEQNKGNKS